MFTVYLPIQYNVWCGNRTRIGIGIWYRFIKVINTIFYNTITAYNIYYDHDLRKPSRSHRFKKKNVS